MAEVKDSGAARAPQLGTGDFAISLWCHTESILDDTLGDLESQYDGASRRGFVLGLQTASGVTTCQPNHRTLHFGIDSGSEPRWTDRGRPGNAVYVMALAVSNGWLHAGTCEPGAGEAGRVYRLERDHIDASVQRWVATGPLDGSNAVSALAEHQCELFAGTLPSGRVQSLRAGTSVTSSRSLEPGWQHLAAVKRGDRLELHVGGSLVGESDKFETARLDLNCRAPLYLGFGPLGHFRGRLRDVRLYSRALCENEIRELAKR